jgi:hypothetical protein
MSKVRLNPVTGRFEAEPLSLAYDRARERMESTPRWRVFRRRRLKSEARTLGLASVMRDMPEIGKHL